MAHSLFSCMIPGFSISKKVLLPSFVRLRNSALIWKTVEVRFVGGVPENSGDTNARSLSLSKLESSCAQNENYELRLLRIAIIGVPNAGKSTVINQLVGRKVCSISRKVHTTRCNARAIGIEGNTQLVFLDTPGLVNSDESHRHHLEHAFRCDSETAMLEADVIGVVHDVSNTWTRDRLDPKVLRLLYLYPRKHSFLILNKIDAVKTKRKLLDVVRLLTNNSLAGKPKTSVLEPSSVIDYTECIEQQRTHKRHNHQVKDDMNSPILSELQVQRKVVNERGWPNFREVFMVSALLGDGMNDIKDYLLHISESSPWLYPVSKFTDQPSETIIVNTVRSKLLDHLPQEIPYNLNTFIEYFDVGKEGTISTVVLVECPTLRLQRLVVGSRGLRVRTIAREAEQELQSTFRQPVRLKVAVTNTSQKLPTVDKKEGFS